MDKPKCYKLCFACGMESLTKSLSLYIDYNVSVFISYADWNWSILKRKIQNSSETPGRDRVSKKTETEKSSTNRTWINQEQDREKQKQKKKKLKKWNPRLHVQKFEVSSIAVDYCFSIREYKHGKRKRREREKRELQANRSKSEHEAPIPPACSSRVPPAIL